MNDLPNTPDGMEEFLNHFKFKQNFYFALMASYGEYPAEHLRVLKRI